MYSTRRKRILVAKSDILSWVYIDSESGTYSVRTSIVVQRALTTPLLADASQGCELDDSAEEAQLTGPTTRSGIKHWLASPGTSGIGMASWISGTCLEFLAFVVTTT